MRKNKVKNLSKSVITERRDLRVEFISNQLTKKR